MAKCFYISSPHTGGVFIINFSFFNKFGWRCWSHMFLILGHSQHESSKELSKLFGRLIVF